MHCSLMVQQSDDKLDEPAVEEDSPPNTVREHWDSLDLLGAAVVAVAAVDSADIDWHNALHIAVVGVHIVADSMPRVLVNMHIVAAVAAVVGDSSDYTADIAVQPLPAAVDIAHIVGAPNVGVAGDLKLVAQFVVVSQLVMLVPSEQLLQSMDVVLESEH